MLLELQARVQALVQAVSAQVVLELGQVRVEKVLPELEDPMIELAVLLDGYRSSTCLLEDRKIVLVRQRLAW